MPPDTAPVKSQLCEVLNSRGSIRVGLEDLDRDAPLGRDGLGFDSIVIAEVLLECEQRFGISPAALLEEGRLTTRRLLAHVTAARAL